MKLVVKLAMAIAALTGPAMLCWGQTPRGDDNAGALGSPTWYGKPSQQVAAQPATPVADGSWVSDDDSVEPPMPAFGPQVNLSGEDYSGSCGEGCSECGEGCGCGSDFGGGCEDCNDPNCAYAGHGAHKHGLFGKHCKCIPMDLWADVHAHHRCYVQGDYISFWVKGNPLPPLVTTSPIGTPQDQAGVLPVSATTSILFGNDRVDTDQRSGGRITLGYWLVDGEFLGVEGQYFALTTANTLFSRTSNFSSGDPDAIILARPFLNVDPNLPEPTQDSAIIAFPNFQIGQDTTNLDGSINIRTVSNLQSANMTFRRLVWIDFTMQRRLDLLLGYRFLYLEDSVTIDDATTIQPSGVIPLTQLTSQDQFRSRNQFHGGEIGIKAQCYHGIWQLEGIAKCGFGNNRERTWINGFNTTTVGGVTTTAEGGLLAQPTNIGSYRRDVFAVLPEADANLRINVTKHLRLQIGYTFIYIDRVQRSGDAIDTTLNPTQIGGTLVGPARPAFFANDSTFWVHGWNAGFEYRW